MNANMIINMVMRLFMRKVLSRGMDAGIDMVTRKRGKVDPNSEDGRLQSDAGAKRAKDAMKVTRRVARF